MVISTSRLDIEDIAFLIVHVSGCGHASGTLEQETYELLLVWVAPPEALKIARAGCFAGDLWMMLARVIGDFWS
jgi:hypothetical protein